MNDINKLKASLNLELQKEVSDNDEDAKKDDKPKVTFADLGLDSTLLAALDQKGYVTPSPIQEQVIPLLL